MEFQSQNTENCYKGFCEICKEWDSTWVPLAESRERRSEKRKTRKKEK